jgi:hypothetical protein
MQTFRHISESVRVEALQYSAPRDHKSRDSVALDAANLSLGSSRVPQDESFKPSHTERGSYKIACAILCVIGAFVSGCTARQKPRARAFPWAAAKNARPLAPDKIPADVSNDDLFAELGLAVPAPPSPVAGTPSGPPRPRVAVVPAGNAGAPHAPEAPMIAPQLSPEQTSAAQQQTAASVSVAERNIAASQGRTLNAMQSDLASKVRSFLAEAHEAVRVGDWTRASNAAKKAEVLSEELANSL